MIEQAQNIVYGFGPYRISVFRRQLLLDGRRVPITAKAFDTLVVLLSRCGEVVSKDDLMLAVWGDTVVEENNLIQQISYLRRLLGERAADHDFIVTVPGRGYRFVAAVRQLERSVDVLPGELAGPQVSRRSSGPNAFLTAADKSRMIGYAWAMALIILVCVPVVLSGFRSSSSPGYPQSLAVLKFRSEAGGDEFIGVGISDTLRARLGSVQDLIVRPGPVDATFQDVVAAGRELKVDAVLTGSVQRSRERIRVTVEVVDVRNGKIVWGRIFDNSVSNLFELQDSIAGAVTGFLQERLTSALFDGTPTGLALFGVEIDRLFGESLNYQS